MEKTIYERAVDEYMVGQPWFERRKNTLFTVVAMFLQAVQVLGVSASDLPFWVAVIFAVVIGVGEALLQAKTQGAVTPSMGKRLSTVASQNPPLQYDFTVLDDVVKVMKDSPLPYEKVVEAVGKHRRHGV